MNQCNDEAGGPTGEVLLAAAFEGLCRRWEALHPKCLGEVRRGYGTINMRWRLAEIADTTREIAVEVTPALKAMSREQIDTMVSGLWASATTDYEARLAEMHASPKTEPLALSPDHLERLREWLGPHEVTEVFSAEIRTVAT